MMNIDATLLRVLFIVAVIFSSGALILVYILAGLVVPKEPPMYTGFGGGFDHNYHNPYGPGHGHYNPGHGPSAVNQEWKQQQQTQQPYSNGYGKRSSDLDAMMEDIEKKALRKEIDELRARIARYEKGDK